MLGECILYNGKTYVGGTKGPNSINSVIFYNPQSPTGIKDSANKLSTCYSIESYSNNLYFAGTPTEGLGATGCVYSYNINSGVMSTTRNTLLQTCYKLYYEDNLVAFGTSSDNVNNVFTYYNTNTKPAEWINIPVKDKDNNNIFTVIYDFISLIGSHFIILTITGAP